MDANDLHPWLYPVIINGKEITPGIGTGQSSQRLRSRVEYHREFLVDAMSERYDFRGKTVLDVGSNCGYFSLEYAKRASRFTHLIEAREMAIRQGHLLWRDAGFYNYRFYHEDVMEVDYSQFDAHFTLCAGILYHVREWELLLDRVNACTKDGILIETATTEQDKTTREEPGYFNAIDANLTKRIPTRGKLLEAVDPYGTVEILSEATLRAFNKKRMIIWVQTAKSHMPTIKSEVITIVSGLPRSGTSMMMAMLEAGGMEVLADGARIADEDNPKGYREFERAKKIQHDQSWLKDAKGKAVKMISELLRHLPQSYTYKVIFMHRKMEEILASQRQMLNRRGELASDAGLAELYQKRLKRVKEWVDQQPNIEAIAVSYNEVLGNPIEHADKVSRFLGNVLNVENMAGVVDPALYRQRGNEC